jgi:hypothetical protein
VNKNKKMHIIKTRTISTEVRIVFVQPRVLNMCQVVSSCTLVFVPPDMMTVIAESK